jgi:redox-sensitive bicupin YhaK (pirin superfamily)
MSAGTGVTHSEFNPSPDLPVHFYQIWIQPSERNVAPSYEELEASGDEQHNRLRLVASRHGRDGSATIHQDADAYLAALDAGAEVVHGLVPGRHAWLQVIRGQLAANGTTLAAGDGLAASDELQLVLRATAAAELLLFDLA